MKFTSSAAEHLSGSVGTVTLDALFQRRDSFQPAEEHACSLYNANASRSRCRPELHRCRCVRRLRRESEPKPSHLSAQRGRSSFTGDLAGKKKEWILFFLGSTQIPFIHMTKQQCELVLVFNTPKHRMLGGRGEQRVQQIQVRCGFKPMCA